MKTVSNYLQVFLIILELTATSCSTQKIIYEPIGIMDKPLPTIEICLKHYKKSENDKVYVLDKTSFNLLSNYLTEKLGDKNADNQSKHYEYGCYKITYYVGRTKTDYILAKKNESYTFFDSQRDIIKSNDELKKEIEILLNRLKPLSNLP